MNDPLKWSKLEGQTINSQNSQMSDAKHANLQNSPNSEMSDAKQQQQLREILASKDAFIHWERLNAIVNNIPRINKEDRYFVDLVLLNAAMGLYGKGILEPPVLTSQGPVSTEKAFVQWALPNWHVGSRTEDECKQLLGAIKECGTVIGDQIYRILAPRTVLVKSKC